METIDDLILSEQSILERVDEYALYCFYLKYPPEIGATLISPIRTPDNPDTTGSFRIFVPTRIKTNVEYLWIDNGTGQKGNIFRMISLMYGGISPLSVLRLIDRDFSLGFSDGSSEIIHHRIISSVAPKIMEACDIKVRSRPLSETDMAYWGKYGIGRRTLDIYNVTSVDMYWLNKHQKHPRVVGKNTLCYAYRIWSKYKIYQPYAERSKKFRNDFTSIHIEGYCQLRYDQPTLIITKALKDVMMFREFGLEAVAGRSENTPIPDIALAHFERKYKRIIVWLDNDGKECGQQYYPNYEQVRNPSGQPKDPSDFRDTKGEEPTAKLISTLTGLL